jgi:two-component system chemotaxis response regulator CheB
MTDIVAIGGSAGSLPVIMEILKVLPEKFDFALVVIVHRLRNVSSDMQKVLASAGNIDVHEPEDKEVIKKGMVYLAPQNYHLQLEEDKTFSLDYSEPVNFSRPSIDVTFDCVASVYGKSAVAILLSGANEDGTYGISRILKKGGVGIVQDPETAEYAIMPKAAIAKNKKALIREPDDIVNYVKTICRN